jgi:DNA-binding transcriptional MerR regulator
LKSTVQQIEWRRSKVLELRNEGFNQSEISDMLKIHKSTINRDLKYLSERARKNVETHLHEKLPEEYQLCMTGLNEVLKKSWEIANSSSSAVDEKTKLQALSLVNDCYKYKMDLVTNGVVITDAIKFVENVKEELPKVQNLASEGIDSISSRVNILLILTFLSCTRLNKLSISEFSLFFCQTSPILLVMNRSAWILNLLQSSADS